MICKSGLPTQDGSKYSDTRTTNSSTGNQTRSSMLEEEKIKKANKLVFGVTTEADINNGTLFILTKQRDHKPRELARNSVSTSTDHSTLCPSFHSTELLSATVPTTSGREDGETML